MKRPTLNRIAISDAISMRPGTVTITMGRGQWDNILLASYELGYTLVELDDDEKPVAAYRNPRPMHRDNRPASTGTNRLSKFLN